MKIEAQIGKLFRRQSCKHLRFHGRSVRRVISAASGNLAIGSKL